MKHLLTYFKNVDPTSLENVGSNYSLGQEWYNTITGDKFYHKSDGVWVKSTTNVSSLIIEVTYSELDALKTGSLLVPGRVYLLTDYMTRYEQPVSGDIISSGVVEPLYVTATGVNTLSNICMSKLYPQDVVYYDIRNMHGGDKGFIHRRIDTIYNNDIGTDWRHVKYRRWAVNVTDIITIGTSYTVGNVRANITGEIFVCAKNHTYTGVEGNPFWYKLWVGNGDFVSYNTNGIRLRTSDTYPVIIPIDINLFVDVHLYQIGSQSINNYIAARDIDELFYNTVIIEQFNNNTVTYNNFNSCTFGTFTKNSIHANLYGNFISAFSGNTVNSVVNNFSDNILEEVTENTFNGSISKNIAEDRITRSDLQDFISNTFYKIDWSVIKNFCSANTFLTIFASEIGSDFYLNFLNKEISSCIFLNYVRDLNIQTNTGILYNWTIEKVDGDFFDGDNIPALAPEKYPRLFRLGTSPSYTHHYTYIDDFGDTIIEDIL